LTGKRFRAMPLLPERVKAVTGVLIARFQQEHLHATEYRFRGCRNDFDQIGKA
jgi:hypothetical protein